MADLIAPVRRLGKKLLRKAGIDIRFIPELGFDAYDDMRKLAGGERPLVFDVGANRGQTIERLRTTSSRPGPPRRRRGRAARAGSFPPGAPPAPSPRSPGERRSLGGSPPLSSRAA